MAAAQTTTTDPPGTTTPPAAGATPKPEGPGGRGHHGGGGGKFGFGGPGGAIHGEFVVPDGNGGYRTMSTQQGEVVSVSSTSIEVKSADGFTKKYVVDDNTLVNAGRDGIADVVKGDQVGVQAIVNGSTANAVRINDRTKVGAIRDKFAPKRNRSTTPTTAAAN